MKSFSWQKWLRTSARLQVVSVIVAIFVWFVVHSGQQVTENKRFDVEVINLPPHLGLVVSTTPSFQVTLEGSLHRIRSFEPSSIPYLLDLSSGRRGRNIVNIDLSLLQLPSGVRAFNPLPSRLELQLDDLSKREMQVQIDPQGRPASGFVLKEVRVEPNPIQISGPKSEIEKLIEIRLPLDVENKKDSFTTSLVVDLPHPSLRSIEAVVVEAVFSQQNLQREFSSVAVRAIGAAGLEASLQPQEATVRVRGSEKAIESFQENLYIEVPVAGLSAGRYRLRGSLPKGVNLEIMELKPESFIVDLR